MVKNFTYQTSYKFLVRFLTIVFLFVFSNGWGQVIVNWDMATNTPTVTGTGVTLGAISQGNNNGTTTMLTTGSASSGYTGASGGNNAGAATYTGAINTATSTYFQFTITPDPGCSFTLTSISFGSRCTGTGPANYSLRETSNLSTSLATGTLATNSAWALYSSSGITVSGSSSLTFRLYGYGGTGSAGVNTANWRIDDLILNITTSCSSSCTAPTTTVSPTTQTVCASSTATIGISTSAASPNYTWQASANGSTGWANVANGTPTGASYSGASTGTLSITAGATYYYRCLVTDGSSTCVATSSTSTLTVNTPPSITTQPVNRTICSGNNTTFSVVASGTSPTYQWQENTGSGYNNITNGGVYSGATTAILSLTGVPASMNSYSYQCVVSVANCTSTTSAVGVLTVVAIPAAPPVPTTALSNPSCGSNTVVAMTSSVSGVTWYWESTAAATSTANSTTTQTVIASTSTVYVKAISNVGSCASTSSSLIVTIGTPVTLTGAAQVKNICLGASTSFSSNGSGTTSKYWQYSADGGATYTTVSVDGVHTGTNLATLSLTSPPVSLNGYLYQMVVNEPGCPLVTSATSTLYISAIPASPPTPTALANPSCGTTSLSAMTSTVSGVTWYWQTTSSGTSTTNPTSSAYQITSTSTIYVTANANGSSCFSSGSSSIAVTVRTPISLLSQPANVSQCAGTNASFSVTASGSTPSYQWQVDDHLGGGFINITGAPYTNFTTAVLTATSITAGMNGYDYRCVVSGLSPCSSVTSSIATLYIASGAPTTAASSPIVTNVGCNGYNITWTNGDGTNRIVVMSTSPLSGTPVNGTNYTANSNFSSATTTISAGEKVVYNGTGNSVVVSGLNATTTYYYRIFEFNNCGYTYLTSGSIPGGSQATSACTDCVALKSAVINACSGSCGGEGNNEFIVMNSGSYAVQTNSTNIQVVYSGGSPVLQNFTESFAAQPSVISNLNSLAGCGTLFVDVSAGATIPPNSVFFIMNQGSCFNSGSFSAYCGVGTIYVAFSSDASWNTSGYFGNNNTPRYFQTNFSALSGCGVTTYSYNNSSEFDFGSAANGDGSSVVFTGTTASYVPGGGTCVPPAIILPINLLDFYATKNEKSNNLTWKVADVENVVYYMIEKSNNGVEYNLLTTVLPAQTETAVKAYSATDDEPYKDITYYKLSTREIDGAVKSYEVIYVDGKDKTWNYNHYQITDNLYIEFKNTLPKNGIVEVYDVEGHKLISKDIIESQTTINTQQMPSGIYFVRISNPYKTENFKVVISK